MLDAGVPQTVSDGDRDGPLGGPLPVGGPVLRVLLHAWRPQLPTSRHHLTGVSRIEFGRGAMSATRVVEDGRAILRLRLPDPMISTDHGRLELRDDGWLLDDPSSKNGAVVAGRPTRCAPVRLGERFELGHTLFGLDHDELDPLEPPDLASDQLAPPLPELATFTPAWRRQLARLAQLAASELPVLLLGESGTGKEVLARALHRLSGRPGPLVAVNCGGLAPQLVEAELFGHRKGAFSGALSDRLGYLRAADRGTLLLDEVGDLPLPAQATLLRSLQERVVVPVGDERPLPIDVRVCAATHRDLDAAVAAGTFRQDLFARLLGLTVTVPPLRARPGDLGLLIASLLSRQPGGDLATFTPAAAYALAVYPWPLNVRELERVLAAAVITAGSRPITPSDLATHLTAVPAAIPTAIPTAIAPAIPGDHDQRERDALVAGLTQHRGNVAALARELGVHREQVHRRLRRFAIDPTRFRG
jgi:DNA-binding NtrC family response regulator